MLVNGTPYRTVWMDGQVVRMIEQRLLPHRFEVVALRDHRETAQAIRDMVIRGAPAIGAAGGYGMAQAAIEAPVQDFSGYLERAMATLRATRPTARNLFYAIERVWATMDGLAPAEAKAAAIREAAAIADDDVRACQAIGRFGADLIGDGARINTHCNAGWLACVDWGTALSPVYTAARQGKRVFVFVDETRPRNQGASLTAWELAQEHIPHTVIADNASGYFKKRKEIDLVIVGADRIAANGDTANKIGTYPSAVVARENGIPFYVAAPRSTIDLRCATGDQIPIEERPEDEVLSITGAGEDGRVQKVRLVPQGATARNPAFDVTPAEYITGIITERGVVKPTKTAIAGLFA